MAAGLPPGMTPEHRALIDRVYDSIVTAAGLWGTAADCSPMAAQSPADDQASTALADADAAGIPRHIIETAINVAIGTALNNAVARSDPQSRSPT